MNLAKTQFKADLAESFGRDFEKLEQEAEKSILRQEGAKDALKFAAKRVGELGEHIDKDVQEGLLAEIGEPLKVAEYAKRYLKRAVGAIDNLATTAEMAHISAGGKQKGLKMAKDYAHKVWKEEREKLDAYVKSLEDGEGDVDGRDLDGHPGPSLKSQRLAEEAKAKEAEEQKPPEPEPEEPPKATKRLRPKQAKKGTKTASKKAPKKKKG